MEMTSIIQTQKLDRNNKIALVEETIRKSNPTDMKEFVIETSEVFKCSSKTAREYIAVAKWRIANG